MTIDAIGCQTKIVEKNIEKQAGYVPPVKCNRVKPHETMRLLFDDPVEIRWVISASSCCVVRPTPLRVDIDEQASR